MQQKEMKWLLKNKLVTDFRGYPIGRVKKVWYDTAEGPLVVVERKSERPSWETIPLRAIDSVRDEVRLKPPSFAE